MLYLDMDGVIVDLVQSVKNHYGLPHHEDTWEIHSWYGMKEEGFWEAFENHDWWANLPAFNGWKEFYDELIRLSGQVMILSKPSTNPQSLSGKVAWLQKHFGGDTFKNFVFTKHKHLLARSWSDILIDDSDANIDEFRLAGGTGIVCPRSYNTMKGFKNHSFTYVINELCKAL